MVMKKCFYLISFFPIIITHSQSVELSLQELCDESSDIVIAKPVSYITFQSENYKHIHTNIKFKVIETIKGRFVAGDNFEMLVYGGELNGITKIVVDAPSYRIGEESLLFLRANRGKEILRIFFTVTGGVQGKYNIYIDKNDGVKHVVRDQSEWQSPVNENVIEIQSKKNNQPTLNEMMGSIKARISKGPK